MKRIAFIAISLALLAGLVRSLTTVYSLGEVTPTPPNTSPIGPRLAERVLLVVIDGMRYDTAFESGAMPFLSSLRNRGASGPCLATEITMTGVGVRTLGTGVSSGIWALARYWDVPPVEFDNVFHALKVRGDQIVVIGNPMWSSLFGHEFAVDDKLERTSKLFHYVNPVYGSDMLLVKRAVTQLAAPGWTFSVVHLGGLDNAAHLWTPHAPPFFDKARAIDHDIEKIVEAAGPNTTVLVTSDHGSSDRGHHGSGEPEARRTPLVLIGPKIVPGARFEADQIDVAPTLAVLLGLPRPAPAEGRTLVEALRVDDVDGLKRSELASAQRYADAFASAHAVAAPRLTEIHELHAWLDARRDGVRWAPLVWAILLGIAAAWAARPWGVVRRHLPLALALVVAEIAFVGWRLHYRAVTIAWSGIERALGDRKTIVLAAGLAVLAAAVGMILRKRELPSLLVLVGLALLGDSLAFPVAWMTIFAAIVVMAQRRIDVVLLALVGAALAATTADHAPNLHVVTPEAAAIAGVAVLSMAFTRKIASALVLGSIAIAAILLHRYNEPVSAFRVALGLWTLLALATCVTTKETALVTLAGALTIGIALLSHPQHALGVIALFALARGVGILVARAGDQRALFAAILVVALRYAFFALFEGEMSISHLEIWIGYVGNPGQQPLWGALAVITKFLLPLFAVAALVGARLDRDDRSTMLRLVCACVLFRIVHVVFWMTIARNTFYGPFVDVGCLLYLLILVAEALVIYGAGGAWAGSGTAAFAASSARRFSASSSR